MANVAEIAVRWLLGDTINANTILHAKKIDSADPFTEADGLLLGQALFQWWVSDHDAGDNYYFAGWNLFPAQVKLLEIGVKRVQPDEADLYTYPGEETPGQLTGSYALYPLRNDVVPYPPQTCFLVQLRTAGEDRQTRGRVYLPAYYRYVSAIENPSDEDTQAGIVHAARRVVIAQQMGHIHYQIRWATLTEGDFEWCVYSRVAGSSLTVNAFRVSDFVRTQRRRTVRPGTWTHFDVHGDSV